MFKTNWNYDFEKNPTIEQFTKPSMTQPDMTYKVRDILKRSQAGQFVPTMAGNYDEDGELSIVRKANFDLTDLDTIKENIKTLNKVKKDLEEVEKKKEEAAAKEEMRLKILEESEANKEAE